MREVSSGGVVIKGHKGDVRVLLIKDIYGRWTWPKGHIEEGESPEEAAAREVAEETGLEKVRVLDNLGRQRYVFLRKGEEVEKTVEVFLISAPEEGDLRPQHGEVLDAGWYPPAEALAKLGYEGAGKFVSRAVELYQKRSGERLHG